jgi:hypothetical protein
VKKVKSSGFEGLGFQLWSFCFLGVGALDISWEKNEQ